MSTAHGTGVAAAGIFNAALSAILILLTVKVTDVDNNPVKTKSAIFGIPTYFLSGLTRPSKRIVPVLWFVARLVDALSYLITLESYLQKMKICCINVTYQCLKLVSKGTSYHQRNIVNYHSCQIQNLSQYLSC